MLLNKRTAIWLAASVVLCGWLAVISLADRPDGKGGGGKEDPPLPPIQYVIRFIDMPDGEPGGHANEMNNSGQIVGYYYLGDQQRAFFYSGGLTHDLTDYVGLPEGLEDWVIASAIGLNEQGDIVGYLKPAGSIGYGGTKRGFLIKGIETASEELQTIPDQSLESENTCGRRINENGDILGLYVVGNQYHWYLYNPATNPENPEVFLNGGDNAINVSSNVVHLSDILFDDLGGSLGPAVTGPDDYGIFRVMPRTNIPKERFAFDGSVSDANGAAAFCGRTEYEVQVRRKTQLVRAPYRYDDGTGLTIAEPEGYTASAINANNDLLVSFGTSTNNFHLDHAEFGLLNLAELVSGTAADVDYWFSRDNSWGSLVDLNDRQVVADPTQVSANQFGQILGNGQRMFLLTPEPLQ